MITNDELDIVKSIMPIITKCKLQIEESVDDLRSIVNDQMNNLKNNLLRDDND